VHEAFAREGAVVETDPSPAAFTEFLQGEIDKWVKVVQISGATME
jgi:hypothetical protein